MAIAMPIATRWPLVLTFDHRCSILAMAYQSTVYFIYQKFSVTSLASEYWAVVATPITESDTYMPSLVLFPLHAQYFQLSEE